MAPVNLRHSKSVVPNFFWGACYGPPRVSNTPIHLVLPTFLVAFIHTSHSAKPLLHLAMADDDINLPGLGLSAAPTLSPLEQLMLAHGFPRDIQQIIIGEYFDVASFALVALSLEDLDSVIVGLARDHGRDFSRREIAAMRAFWQACRNQQTPPPEGVSASSVPSLPVPSSVSAAHSWSESFPAKLTVDQVRQMQLDFERSYPSEVLDAHSMPGPRLLALVHHQLQSKQLKWVHWNMRLSQYQHEQHSSTRPKKLAKLETLSMTDLILDDVPTRDLPPQLGAAGLSQILSLQATALALCKGAHLHGLKLYVAKFLRLALHRYEPETGLRGPVTSEMMFADQELWSRISELVNLREWSLDDALHEMVKVRSDMDSLLQPRFSSPCIYAHCRQRQREGRQRQREIPSVSGLR